jgi:hypothetical protein
MYTCLGLLGVLLAYMIARSGSASHAAAGEIAADDSLANGRRSLRAAARCGVVAVTARCVARTASWRRRRQAVAMMLWWSQVQISVQLDPVRSNSIGARDRREKKRSRR